MKVRLYALAGLAALALLLFVVLRTPFPSDQTPEGAYLRVAEALGRGAPQDAFPYLEEDARHAAYTIQTFRKKACDRVRASFPPKPRDAFLAEHQAEADAPSGEAEFVLFAEAHGLLQRLRRDLSGVGHVERDGDRATVVTARGTRYSLRRRDNGIWGLTMFTAELLAEAERAARDSSAIDAAADDYDRVKPP